MIVRDLVVFSHLRWDFVWQRPQQLLARLASQFNILFVEEPLITADPARPPYIDHYVWYDTDGVSVRVARMSVPAQGRSWIGHGDAQTADTYEALLSDFLADQGIVEPVVWFYTPMAQHFLNVLEPELVIYDVMDQLSAFKGASPELRDSERQLLRMADLVFTGGLSLFEDKKRLNPNTYLFPSGVEIEHFAQAASPETFDRPVELSRLDGPVLGYFGVIDERMDVGLLAHIATTHLEWQLVLIGPVCKIDPAALPQADNIHYLAMRSYEELPEYLAHFDVALIPFALNEATRYLSPTKTLEYMAAHKPIVSTPIHDVKALFGAVVSVAETPDAFVAAIRAALEQPPSAHKRADELRLLSRYTWDAIVSEMSGLIEASLEEAVAEYAS
jgi:UDP-galactopyranose mutase